MEINIQIKNVQKPEDVLNAFAAISSASGGRDRGIASGGRERGRNRPPIQRQANFGVRRKISSTSSTSTLRAFKHLLHCRLLRRRVIKHQLPCRLLWCRACRHLHHCRLLWCRVCRHLHHCRLLRCRACKHLRLCRLLRCRVSDQQGPT